MQGRYVNGAKLRDIRERQGLRRPELAKASGISLSYIKYIELEGRQPSGVVAHALARALKVNISAFTQPLNDDRAGAA